MDMVNNLQIALDALREVPPYHPHYHRIDYIIRHLQALTSLEKLERNPEIVDRRTYLEGPLI